MLVTVGFRTLAGGSRVLNQKVTFGVLNVPLGGGLGGLLGWWRVRRKPEVHRGSPAPLSHHCLRPFLGNLNIIPSNSLSDRTNQLSKTTPL